MGEPPVAIFDIMACNVYWDFDDSRLPKQQHKFLVSFYPTEDVPTPALIDDITVLGPDGYQNSITNQMFTADNRDGWIYDSSLNFYWYMVNVTSGYLAEGRYTIEIALKNGDVLSRARTQQDGPGAEMATAYLGNREKIVSSFSPSTTVPLPADTPVHGITCRWATLSDVGGPEAYYIYRIAEGGSSRGFNTQKIVWWDNIFIQRQHGNDLLAGLDKNDITIGADLKSETTYAYFVEITDANAQNETNICTFQPHQIFVTHNYAL